MTRFSPHPIARASATVIAIAGTVISMSALAIAVVWVAVLLPMFVATRLLRQHAIFVLAVFTPISLQLVLVWGFVVGASPGAPVGSSPEGGLAFALLTALRIGLLGGIVQLSVLTIRSEQLIYTFTACGLRGDWLIAALGTFALGPELALRSQQVLTARYARGLVADRHFLTRLRQLPYLLRPLFGWVLRSAIQRSEAWHQRQLIHRLGDSRAQDSSHSVVGSGIYLALATAWLLCNALWR